MKYEQTNGYNGTESSASDAQAAEANAEAQETQQAESASEEARESKEETAKPRQPTYIETLERKVQESQDQLREYIQAYKKVKEEMDDVRRRLEREAQRDLTMLRGRLVTELLEVMDNLDRSVDGGEQGWNASALLDGMKMVRGQFLEKLQALGLQMIDPVGQPFDPNEAEALDVTATSDASLDNTVSRVYTRGFKLQERIIRPARVQVARHMDMA